MKRLNNEGEGIAVETDGNFFAFVFLAAAFVWFGLLFYLADDYLWSNPTIIIFSLISLAAAYLLAQNLFQAVRRLTSRSKSYLLVTPLYIIDLDFNDLQYWNLEQLAAVDSKHNFQNRAYKFTEIKLNFENFTKVLKIRNRETAEEFLEKIDHLRKLFIEATVRKDEEYLNSNDDFIGLKNQGAVSDKTAPRRNLKNIVLFAIAAVFAAGIMFAAVSLNNYYDDKKSWEAAESVNRAYSFRSYLETHPRGRWSAEAKQKLQAFYDVAARKYQSSLNPGYDPKAAEAVLKILDFAKTTQNFRVKVDFERRNEIPPDVVEKLKKEYEVKKMIPLDDTFSDEKMSRREALLLSVVAEAFGKIIPDDVLEISGECPSECVTFLVKYRISSEDIYYDLRQKKVPDDERVYYPGIFIDWDFGIKIPNQSDDYNFNLASKPAEEIEYDSNSDALSEANKDFADVLNADKGNIYNSMAASAFEDFKENLIFRMGIGTLPKNRVEKTPETEKDIIKAKEK